MGTMTNLYSTLAEVAVSATYAYYFGYFYAAAPARGRIVTP